MTYTELMSKFLQVAQQLDWMERDFVDADGLDFKDLEDMLQKLKSYVGLFEQGIKSKRAITQQLRTNAELIAASALFIADVYPHYITNEKEKNND